MTDSPIVPVPMVERVQPADLAAVQMARLRAQIALKDLEVLQLRVFVRYGLTENDGFDADTGVITRAAPPAGLPEPHDG